MRMSKLPWKPWHQVVQLRSDVRTGELSLSRFAADLYDVIVVALLLGSEPTKSDMLGKKIASELFTIFRREREESVQPVLKEDLAEILRLRFFVSESIKDRESFLPHVMAALKGVADHDESTASKKQEWTGILEGELNRAPRFSPRPAGWAIARPSRRSSRLSYIPSRSRRKHRYAT